MRKLFCFVFLFISLMFLTGCDKEKPAVIFSNTPFRKETMYRPQNVFHTGEKIYYAIYNPKGFNTRLLKLQIFKKSDNKSEFWAYEYLYNRTIELTNKNIYTDYAVINNAGTYVFQFFDYTDFQEPVVLGVVKVEKN